MSYLDNTVALITGASSRIGAAAHQPRASSRVRVVLAGRSQAKLIPRLVSFDCAPRNDARPLACYSA
jgi:NADP-dependent 3-hydroxy acid dehydrogenase YdfG